MMNPRAAILCFATALALVWVVPQELNEVTQETIGMRTSQPDIKAVTPNSNLDDAPSKTTNAPSNGPAVGNPLWATPLTSLTATRERPIFSASRRPPPTVERLSVRPLPTPVATEPSRPLLALVGAIAGEGRGIAILVDETTRAVVRLRTGESYSGWTLREVKGREAVLQKERQSAVLTLPVPSVKANP